MKTMKRTIAILVSVLTAMLCSSHAAIISGSTPKPQHRADSLQLPQGEEELGQTILRARQPSVPFYRHELRGGLGFGHCQAGHDRDRMLDSYLPRYELTAEGECFDLIGDAYSQVGVEYHYRLNRKWDIGVLADWGISREGYSAYYPLNPMNAGTPETYTDDCAFANEFCRFFAVAPSVRYIWYEIRGYRCYSRMALGALRHHLTFNYERYCQLSYHSPDFRLSDGQEPFLTDSMDKIKWRMAYQLTALGITFGGDNFNLFGELGYGSLGVVRLGLSFIF